MQEVINSMLMKLDSFTYNHSVRTMSIAVEVEEYLKMDNHELSGAALLHDLGKIYVAPAILDKTSRLNVIERELVDLHSYVGYMLLKDMKIDERICRIVLYHHGFEPITLSDIGDFIDSEVRDKARMLHTIDVFEALTSDRPYHRGLPSRDALSLMKESDFHEKILLFLDSVIQEERNSAVRRSFEENKNNIMSTIGYIHAKSA